MAIIVEYAGPLFERGQRIVFEYLEDVKTHVARAGEAILGMYGHQFFRYEHSPRTGQWEANVRSDIVGLDRVISDNVVYNAWLEGVGSRNETSRFKGYRLWRLTTQDLNRQKDIIAEARLRDGGYLERLNV